MTKIQSSLGKTIIFLAKFLNLFRKKPVVLDAFLSLYDTIISDRVLVSPCSVKARVIWWLDRMSCRLADLVLLDTEEHIKFFVSEFGINSDKFVRVFVGAEEIAELGSYILKADVCLGVFGGTEKAKRVIPCKVYDCMALGKPIITGDTPAARELLTDRETAVLCPVADPASIAKAMLRLKADKALCETIGKRAERLYQEQCSPKAIGRDLKPHLERLIS